MPLKEQNLREMQLHETMPIGQGSMITVTKVIGGWIYWYKLPSNSGITGVFVPEE